MFKVLRQPAAARPSPSAVAKNRLANFAHFATTASIGLIINPILLATLGATGFGTWKTLQRIFETAIASQGGATQALKWLVAQRKPDDDAEMQRLIGLAVIAWLRWLPAFVALAIAIILALPHLVAGLAPGAVGAAAILALNAVLAGVLTIPVSVLIGDNKGYLALSSLAFAAIFTALAQVWAALLGWSLTGMALATVAGAIFAAAATCWLARKHLTWFGWARPHPHDSARLAPIGRWTLVGSYLERLLLSSDVLLIALLLGAGAVGHYVFSAFAIQLALSLCLLTTNAAMPALSQFAASGQWGKALGLVSRTRAINAALMAMSGTAIVAFNPAFVDLWAGPGIALDAPTNALVVLAGLQLAHMRNETQCLDALLVVRERVLVVLLGSTLSLLFATISFLLVPSIGSIFIGLIVGRLPATFVLPLLTKRHLCKNSPQPIIAGARLWALAR